MESYIVCQCRECFSACFCNYLNYIGIDLKEYQIFFEGNGYTPQYISNTFPIDIAVDISKAVLEFLKNYHVTVEKRKYGQPNTAQYFLQDSLNDGNPVIMLIDSGYLEYSHIFNREYGQQHFITAISADQNVVEICDGFVPTNPITKFQGMIPLQTLLHAWEATGFQHYYIDPSSLLFLKDYCRHGISQQQQNLVRSLKNNLSDYLNGFTANGIHYGINAVTQFIEDFKNVISIGNTAPDLFQKLNFQLKIQGLTASKKLLSDCIDNIHSIPNRSEIIDKLTFLVKQWDILCIYLMKISLSQNQKNLDKLQHLMGQLKVLELSTHKAILKSLEMISSEDQSYFISAPG